MSNEASRDQTPRFPSLGPSAASSPGRPSRLAAVAAASLTSHRTTTPDALEEAITDSRSSTPTLPEGSSSPTGAGAGAGSHVPRGVGAHLGGTEEGNDDILGDARRREERSRRSRRRRRRNAQVTAAARKAVITQTKIKFLTDFIRSLDMVVYYYFSYMYFLDNSFFRFFVRCAIQLNFLTPKPITLPTPPQRRTAIIGLFGWTIINLLMHILGAAPEAGEATGGWLHGGLLIDFIGQEGPISKLRLVVTDLTILLLQLIMLAAIISKQGLLQGVTETRRGGGAGDRGQDLDSEERGEIRRERDEEGDSSDDDDNDDDDDDDDDDDENDGEVGEDEDSERHRQRRRRRQRRSSTSSSGSMNGVDSDNNDRESPSHSPLLGDRTRRQSSTSRRASIGGENDPGNGSMDDDGGRYAQYSGQLLVAELSIVDAVRWQWNHGSPGSVAGGGVVSGSGNGSRGT